MTIVEEIATNISQQKSPPPTQHQEIEEEIFKKPYPVTKSAPLQKSDDKPEVKTADVKKVSTVYTLYCYNLICLNAPNTYN